MNRIGTENENSLHAQIKELYAQTGDKVESRVGNYIIDLVRHELLIEIQTGNFSAIRNKLKNLVDDYQVRLIYPIAKEKWLVHVDEKGKLLRRRKSPKKGRITDIFYELIRIPQLITHPNFSLEVLFIREEEVRCNDGKGSWRRKGVSIVDCRLLDVVGEKLFKNKEDFLSLLPTDLPSKFTNHDLSKLLDISIYRARKMSYCLRKMTAIEVVGKKGNTYLYSAR
ncbi:hypothetical protein KKB83_04650 [Patescibacteria group bacterium]|nr:hypothetical protein [Patescibacteria group bacterium]